LFIVIFSLLAVAACESPVEITAPRRAPALVLNCVLEAGADSTEVTLALTRPGDATGDWALVKGARVELFEEGAKVADAVERAPGRYHFNHAVRAATIYKVSASHPDHGAAWGETTVPSPFEALIDTAGRFVVNRWKDSPDERNVYWLGDLRPYDRWYYGGARGDSLLLSYAIYTASLLVDPFNRTIDNSEEINTCYENLARVEDSGLDGQSIEVTYLGGRNCVPFITSVDAHYDAFIKSSLLNEKHNFMMETLPIFHEPAYSFSNIRGGVGLVASRVTVRRNLLRPYPSRLVLLPWYISMNGAAYGLKYDDRQRVVEISRSYYGGDSYVTRLVYASDAEFTATTRDPYGVTIETEHYKQIGDKVFLNGVETITLTPDGRLLSAPGERFVTDERGNVLQSVTTDEQGNETLREFAYDGCNGVFMHVTTPAWYIYTRVLPGFTANNRVSERVDGVETAWSLGYNRNDYPNNGVRVGDKWAGILYIDTAGKEYYDYATYP
jgi:hypothetical protein